MLRFLALSVVALSLMTMPALAQRMDQMPLAGNGSAFFQQQAPKVRLKDGIAVIVNDEAITKGDVRARLSLALMSAGMPDLPETRSKILPRVMRALIEEKLVTQEAAKLGITVADKEVQAAIAHIAMSNKVPGGDMKGFLASKGVPFSTLYSQIKGSIEWSKLVVRSIRPRIEVSDEEVDAAVQSLNDNAGKQEYLLSEIFLAVDKDSSEDQVKAFATKLYEQITAGAVFSSVARQFSQGTGAMAGGDIGWIRAGELAPELDQVLKKMDTSSVSHPVRSGAGYHILGLRDKRVVAFGDVSKVKVKLGQVYKASANPDLLDRVIEEAEQVRQKIKSCDGIEDALGASFDGWKWKELGSFDLGKAPQWLADTVVTLKEGEAGTPMATGKGVLMVYVCDRLVPTAVDRKKIRRGIGAEKMQRMSRGFLRDLRRDAYIDVRLKGAHL